MTLTVDGSPQGATVLIDGQPRGMLPLEVRVQPGTHEVTLSMEGYESASESVQTVEPAPSKVSLHLAPLTKEEAHADSRRLNALIGGTVLMGAGAVTLAVALGTLAGRGCIERAPKGDCMEERVVAPAPLALWTSIGAAALIGGASWLVVAKLKQRPGRETQVTLHAGIGQLALTGRFP